MHIYYVSTIVGTLVRFEVRLNHSMAFQVSDHHDRRVGYILKKGENATPELFAIYMQIQQMKVYLNF